MSQIIKAFSELGCSSRSKINNRTLVPATLNNDKIELDQDTFQNQELEIQEMENRLVNWSMPEIKFKEIYKIGTFDFKSQKIIHTVESATSVSNKHETINLLNKKLLETHYREGYRYIHLGLIQIAIKPLHKLGLNTPILLVLRDTRIKDFHNSTIAIVESNLNDGPVYFNCHPNYSMSLADEFTKNSLVIYVQGLSDNFNPGVANIDVISRITYKVSNVNYDFKSLKTTPRNETCIIEANLSRSNVMTPKIMTASDIIEKFPQEWILQDVVKSEKIEARTIRDVIQDIDGSVRIRMNRSQSYHYHQSSSIGSTSSARHSVDSTIRVNLAGVNITPTIPQPLYSERTSRSPYPTESQILGVITNDEPFVIDKAWIRADFEAIYNLEKRNWYFSNFSKDQTQMYLQNFYRFLETHEINIYFFTWFELLCLE
jgi:hypothetical protein